MKKDAFIRQILFATVLCTLTASVAKSAILWSNSVSPTDPTTWDENTYAYVGKSGLGTLTVNNGDNVLSYHGTIGSEDGSTGQVTIDGNDSTWENSEDLTIGGQGNGTLEITNGGSACNDRSFIASSDSSVGIVNVTGDSSTWTNLSRIYVGYLGNGTLNIKDSGTVNSDRAYIACYSDSVGLVTVDGNGSTWTDSQGLSVGRNGNGTLKITNGGVVTINNSTSSSIAYAANSTGLVVVDGVGSTWTNSERLYLGEYGNASLEITNGGTVNNAYCYVGYYPGSIGQVTVSGNGSTWNNTESGLYVGYEGNGSLDILDGAEVTVAKSTCVSYPAGSSGSIHFDGGTLTTASLQASLSDLTGTGTINAGGLVTDIDLIFDATHGLNQTLTLNDNSNQNITVKLNANASGAIGAGYGGTGTLQISDGVVLESDRGIIGYKSGSTGIVTVTGNGSQWVNNGMSVAVAGNGTLEITNGAKVANNKSASIGVQANSNGLVIVDGADSEWTNYIYVYVGDEGNGEIRITNGGIVEAKRFGAYLGYESNSNGKITVDGDGSAWNVSSSSIGYRGDGTLTITNGGYAYSSSTTTIGNQTDSTGVVTVDGSSSAWYNYSGICVGSKGNGTLNITNGGTATVRGDTLVASYSGSSGTINFDNGTLETGNLFTDINDLTGTGTINTKGFVGDGDLVFDATHGATQTWTLNENSNQNITINLSVNQSSSTIGAGYKSTGTMRVSDGVVVESENGILGYLDGSYGLATVDGIGSTWNSSRLTIGSGGDGKLEVTNGGTVYAKYVTLKSTSSATVDGNESTLSNDSLQIDGMLEITNGGTVICDGKTTVLSSTDSSGTILFDNGTLETSGLCAKFSNLTGTGTINAKGLVCDMDLVFDATHGTAQTWTLNQTSDQNITLNLNVDNTSTMGAGFHSEGTMRISDGVVIDSERGIISYQPGSKGLVTIEGNGSTWNTDHIAIGGGGNGTLEIVNGGMVNSNYCSIGDHAVSEAVGHITVSGSGSKWINQYQLNFDRYCCGTLYIADQGFVSVGGTLEMWYYSVINMSGGGMLALSGDAADSLNDFLDLIRGTDAIQWWDDSLDTNGDWASLTTATLDTDYTLEYFTDGELAGYTLLTVGNARIPGDANCDGIVDGSDVTILAANWQKSVTGEANATWKMGDFNDDGIVDGSDVTILAANWQKNVNTSMTAVPEPGVTIMLLSLLTIAPLLHKKQAI